MALLIETMCGEEVFTEGNAKVHVFVSPTKLFPAVTRELHIGLAAGKTGMPVRVQQRLGQFNAYSETFRDDCGKWTQTVYEVSDGALLKLYAHRANGFGARVINACQFLRAREGAAYREIKCKLTQSPKARFDYAIIKGCFDIIPLADAIKLGAKVPISFTRMYDEREVSAVMEFIKLGAETKAPVQVQERTRERDGEKVVVQRIRERRVLNLED